MSRREVTGSWISVREPVTRAGGWLHRGRRSKWPRHRAVVRRLIWRLHSRKLGAVLNNCIASPARYRNLVGSEIPTVRSTSRLYSHELLVAQPFHSQAVGQPPIPEAQTTAGQSNLDLQQFVDPEDWLWNELFSGNEHRAHAAVLLVLEHGVAARPVLEREAVRREVGRVQLALRPRAPAGGPCRPARAAGRCARSGPCS